MRKTRRFNLERLEDRSLLTGLAGIWPGADSLTISFVPDGTPALGTHSNLFATFNAKATTVTWETEVLRAFRSWAASADINLTLVTDDGSPFGVAGAPQGDSRFGDIRIGAAPLGSPDVATTQPFSYSGSTWSGDVLLNSSMNFSVAGGAGVYDLFTVMMHEAGHSFGLGDSQDPTSAMYETYSGLRTGPSAADVHNLQLLYGPRPANSPTLAPLTTTPVAPGTVDWNGQVGTTSATTNLQSRYAAALPVNAASNLVPQWTGVGFGSVNGAGQSGWWSLRTPTTADANPFTLTAVVWVTAPAGQTPQMALYDANLKPLPARVLYNGNGSFTVQLAGVQMGGALYYLQVNSPSWSILGHGGFSYNVAVNLRDGTTTSLTTPASGTLTASSPQQSQALAVAADQLMLFSLSVSLTGINAPTPPAVQMLIYDASGHVVFSQTVSAGQPPATVAAYLQAGAYTVTFAAVDPHGSWQTALTYNLTTEILSDPIGALPINPATGSSTSASTSSGSTSTTTMSSGGTMSLFLMPGVPTASPT
jgi:hypothetical protein